jgi:hypothetical protein
VWPEARDEAQLEALFLAASSVAAKVPGVAPHSVQLSEV